jgi:hypothetical protein
MQIPLKQNVRSWLPLELAFCSLLTSPTKPCFNCASSSGDNNTTTACNLAIAEFAGISRFEGVNNRAALSEEP